LPVSAGVTIYVAASDLMPEVNEEPGVKLSLWVFGGVVLFIATRAVLQVF
jgi:ZIP family zinc transporter/zinc and cadmium transporter